MQTCSAWCNLKPFPKLYCSQPVVLNKDKLIVATDIEYLSNAKDGDGIYTFNVKENEWNLLIKYPTNYTVTCSSICYDFEQQLLYIYSGNTLLICNLITKQCIVKSDLLTVGWYPKCIMIDNQYNVICGEQSKYHLKWNKTNETFERMYEFKHLLYGNASPGVVHLKSKNMIILFGGVDDSGYGDHGKMLDMVWKYTLNDKKWIKMDIKVPDPTDIFGYASSTDDKYIFIVGGRIWAEYDEDFEHMDQDSIYIINTEIWKVTKSKINCPMKGQYHACIVAMPPSNNYLAAGYIRMFCVLYKIIVPLDVINIISSCYLYDDYLHILKKNGHWKININHLIHAN